MGLLHKKLYEKNITINNNIKSFFKGLFNKSFEELSGVHFDCLTTGRYIQHSAEQIESSGQTCRQIEDSLSSFSEITSSVGSCGLTSAPFGGLSTIITSKSLIASPYVFLMSSSFFICLFLISFRTD